MNPLLEPAPGASDVAVMGEEDIARALEQGLRDAEAARNAIFPGRVGGAQLYRRP